MDINQKGIPDMVPKLRKNLFTKKVRRREKKQKNMNIIVYFINILHSLTKIVEIADPSIAEICSSFL